MISKVFEVITKERAVGTAANDEIVNFLENKFKYMNYSIKSLPFECTVWKKGKSTLMSDNYLLEVEPSPFSESFKGNGKLIMVKTVEELEEINCNDVILVLAGKLAESPLQPKDYPFYYPEEHKYLISLLERKKPRAIIAVTGHNPLSGQNPFPLFDDGNFLIPSGNINDETLSKIEVAGLLDEVVNLTIDSHKRLSKSRQIVALKKAKTAISFHNLNDNISEIINFTMSKNKEIVKAQEWYAGDHVPFIFSGIPCLVVTSSDLFNGALEYTHTPKDTLDTIDFDMVEHIISYIAQIVSDFSV